MKVAPIIEALRNDADVRLVHTGQHYDAKMSETLFLELGLPTPDVNFAVGSSSHTSQTAAVMSALESDLTEHRPDAVIAAGDVNSTLAAALTASQLQIPVAHIEAGLRSHDWTMPEELNRAVTDRVSTWLFTPSEDADQNLRLEGSPESRIHLVGNVMVDTLMKHRLRSQALAESIMVSLGLPSTFGLITLHRASNVDSPETLAPILRTLAQVGQKIPLLMPLHPRTAKALKRHGARIPEQIRSCEALTYLEFLALLGQASIVFTDSGGVQEESSILGVPCLTLRTSTERPITCRLGTNRLVGLDPDTIVAAAEHALDHEWEPATIPLWDGRTAQRVAAVLLTQL
jgi:UDP-N-acetylglucosamine 2-epimerase (non-hydrolysing)